MFDPENCSIVVTCNGELIKIKAPLKQCSNCMNECRLVKQNTHHKSIKICNAKKRFHRKLFYAITQNVKCKPSRHQAKQARKCIHHLGEGANDCTPHSSMANLVIGNAVKDGIDLVRRLHGLDNRVGAEQRIDTQHGQQSAGTELGALVWRSIITASTSPQHSVSTVNRVNIQQQCFSFHYP